MGASPRPVGTGGGVGWLRGPGACPGGNTMRQGFVRHEGRIPTRTGTRPPVPTGRGDASTPVIRKVGSVSLYPVGIARNKTLYHFIPHILVKIFPLENIWLQWVMQNIVANES